MSVSLMRCAGEQEHARQDQDNAEYVESGKLGAKIDGPDDDSTDSADACPDRIGNAQRQAGHGPVKPNEAAKHCQTGEAIEHRAWFISDQFQARGPCGFK